MTTPTAKKPRRYETPIPYQLNKQFNAKLAARHDSKPHRVKDFVKDAARAAASGVRLPSDFPSGVDTSPAAWSQHPDEHAECVSAIQGAHGTMRAVVLVAVQAYVDDPREVLPLDWTPFPLRKRSRRTP